MKLLKQVTLLFALCWLSLCVESLLPIDLPASVIGMVLLLLLLSVRVIRVEHIRELSDFLLENLPLLFVPATVGIIQYFGILKDVAVQLLLVCLISVVLTFAATVTSVRLTIRLMNRRKK